MECPECGAKLPDGETCLNRFHATLAAEWGNAELARMHGLTVLTYHVQHPSLTKPWYQIAAYELMRCIFGQGQDWWAVLNENRQRAHAPGFIEWKKDQGTIMPAYVVTNPIPGEQTIADIDLEAPAGQTESVLAWARSVAMGRVVRRANPHP